MSSESKSGWASDFLDEETYARFIVNRTGDFNHRERPADQNIFEWLMEGTLEKGADGKTLDETLRSIFQ